MVTSCYPISNLPSSDLSYTHHSPTPLPAPPLANMYSWVDGLLNLISTPPPPLLRNHPFFLLLKKSPNCIHPCRLPLVMGLPLKNFFHEFSVSRFRLPLRNLQLFFFHCKWRIPRPLKLTPEELHCSLTQHARVGWGKGGKAGKAGGERRDYF